MQKALFVRAGNTWFRRSATVATGAAIMIASGLASAAGETPEGGVDSAAVVDLIKAAGVTVGVVGVACMGVYLALKGFQWARSAIK